MRIKFALVIIVFLVSVIAEADSSRKIGLLVPLSGKLATYGKNVKHGAELAVLQYNKNQANITDRIDLIVRDTKGEPEETKKNYEELANDSRCIAVIGPISSSCVLAITDLIKNKELLIITPGATQEELVKLNPFIFRNVLTPQIEGEGIAEYLVNNRNIKKTVLLYPSNTYSTAAVKSFASKLTSLNATIVMSLQYESGQSDFKEIMLKLGGIDPDTIKETNQKDKKRFKTEAIKFIQEFMRNLEEPDTKIGIFKPFVEGKQAKKHDIDEDIFSQSKETIEKQLKIKCTELTAKNDELNIPNLTENKGFNVVLVFNITEDESELVFDGTESVISKFYITASLFKKNGTVEEYELLFKKSPLPKENPNMIEAIYMPSSSQDASQIISQLKFFDLDFMIVGSSEWNYKELIEYAGKNANGVIFPIAFYSESSNKNITDFIEQYKTYFTEEPDELATQAYDSASMLIHLIQKGADNRRSLYEALLQLTGFNGLTGEISFNGTGEAKKNFPLLTIQNNKLVQLR